MQTVTNYTPDIFPLGRENSFRQTTCFFLMPAHLFQHFKSLGYASSDMMDYGKLRQAFSQSDLAELIGYNMLTFNAALAKKIDVLDPFHSFFNMLYIEPIRRTMTEAQLVEYTAVLLPLADIYIQQQTEVKPPLSPEEKKALLSSTSVGWKFIPSISNDYYVIVVTEDFLTSLQVRSKCQSFISECLQIDIAHRGLDVAQRSSLYTTYLKLLQKQSQNIFVL